MKYNSSTKSGASNSNWLTNIIEWEILSLFRITIDGIFKSIKKVLTDPIILLNCYSVCSADYTIHLLKHPLVTQYKYYGRLQEYFQLSWEYFFKKKLFWYLRIYFFHSIFKIPPKINWSKKIRFLKTERFFSFRIEFGVVKFWKWNIPRN